MRVFMLCAKYIWRHKILLIIYILISILSSGVTLLSPYITGNFIDYLVGTSDSSQLYIYCLWFAGISVFTLIAGFFSSLIYTKIQSRMGFEMNEDMIQHVQRASILKTAEINTAYLSQRLNNDSNSLIIFCISSIQSFLIQVLMFVVPLAVMLKLYIIITVILLA